MAKTKFFRIAVEGPTVDGREITRQQIQQMADTYNVATRAASINCEHLYGFSPNPPFNNYGVVTALKAEDFDLPIGGKTEKRLALYAQFDVNDQAVQVNKAGQKRFSSVEILPELPGTGQAYLFGVALTDTPASLGTEVLKFSARADDRKANLIALSEFTLEYEDEPAADEVTGAFSAMRKFFENFGAAPKAPVAPATTEPKTDPAPHADLAAFATQMASGFAALENAFTANDTKRAADIAKIADDLAALNQQFNTQPNGAPRRPTATGGNNYARADC